MSEATQPLRLSHDGRGVATVLLNRPERHNALSGELIGALDAALAALDGDPACRVVVLGATGRSFCAGADIDEMRRAGAAPPEENEREAGRLAALLGRLDRLSKPTVARIQGNAFGGALGLIAACDIAVAVDSAQFALTEVRLGLVPAMISPFVLRAIGERQARRYFLTGERFGAPEALGMGLVHKVSPAADLDAASAAVVAELLRGAPAAQAEAKRLLRQVAGRSDAADASLAAATAAWIARLRASAEGREGLSAFLEKRAPSWRQD